MNRRQPFITHEYVGNILSFTDSAEAYWDEHPLEGDSPKHGAALTEFQKVKSAFIGLLIRYTAGVPIKSLEGCLERLVVCHERYQVCLGEYHEEEHIAPLNIEDWLCQYEEFVQVVSLCVLLHRVDLLRRFVTLFDRAGFAGQDVLYEDLLKKTLPGRAEVSGFYHEGYRDLIEVVYAESREASSGWLKKYVTEWYSRFETCAWHDSHLTMTEGDGSYYGYWAFEAAAIAYLYGVNDAHVENMVYPRDLLEYARALDISQASAAGEVN
ncbi:PoNe immunity protein domain-containing protein [Pseudomonas xanthosomatis]|uniref:PoNe immunity protein domain-containing protein n=1 Tax=Pseudomonas xanthosomatis TaxID=2842356 RepID=UPI0035160284